MLSSADWPGSGSSLSERKKTVFRSSSSWVTAGRGAGAARGASLPFRPARLSRLRLRPRRRLRSLEGRRVLVLSGVSWSSAAGASADGLSAVSVSVPVSMDVSVSVSGSSSAAGAGCAGDASVLERGALLASVDRKSVV